MGNGGFGGVVGWHRSELFEGRVESEEGKGGRGIELLSLPGDSRPSSGGRCR